MEGHCASSRGAISNKCCNGGRGAAALPTPYFQSLLHHTQEFHLVVVIICSIPAMLCAFRVPRMRNATRNCYFCTSKDVDADKLRIHVTHKYLPLADSTSMLDDNPRCSRASIVESLKTIEERQEQRKKSGIFAIEGTRCKHGFPRAFVVS